MKINMKKLTAKLIYWINIIQLQLLLKKILAKGNDEDKTDKILQNAKKQHLNHWYHKKFY